MNDEEFWHVSRRQMARKTRRRIDRWRVWDVEKKAGAYPAAVSSHRPMSCLRCKEEGGCVRCSSVVL